MARPRTTTTLWQRNTKENDKFRDAQLKAELEAQGAAATPHHQEADLTQFRTDQYKAALKEAKDTKR